MPSMLSSNILFRTPSLTFDGLLSPCWGVSSALSATTVAREQESEGKDRAATMSDVRYQLRNGNQL